jgi:hypothetical protein
MFDPFTPDGTPFDGDIIIVVNRDTGRPVPWRDF